MEAPPLRLAEQQEFAVEHLRQKEHTWFNPVFPLAYPSLAGKTDVTLRRAAEAEVRTANRALDQLRRLKREEVPIPEEAEPELVEPEAKSPERSQSPAPEPPESPTITPDSVPPDSETGPQNLERRVALPPKPPPTRPTVEHPRPKCSLLRVSASLR